MKICFIASVPFVFTHHLKNHIEALLEAGHSVYLVSSKDSQFSTSSSQNSQIPNTIFYGIEIPRKISITLDLVALFRLYFFFRRNNFDIVHSITSKAGFITAIAAILANIRYRFHSFVGQPWLYKRGLGKLIPKVCDLLIITFNTQCYADSFSQRNLLIAELSQRAKSIKVLGAGSLSGVDIRQFIHQDNCLNLKRELGITNQLVITFIGRLTEEKGIRELIESFIILNGCYPGKIHLLLIGPFENANPKFNFEIKEILSGIQNISLVGYTKNPEIYLSFTDIFCLPSYREGFGTVVIEAAAMGIPAVVSRVVGLIDSVVENHTGLFCSPRNIPELVEALRIFILNSSMRLLYGENAKKRAMNFFRSDIVVKNFIDEYDFIAKDNFKN